MLDLSSDQKSRQVVNMQIKNQLLTFRRKLLKFFNPSFVFSGDLHPENISNDPGGVTAELANDYCSNALFR